MQVEGKVKTSQEELSKRDNEIQELRVSVESIDFFYSHLFRFLHAATLNNL